MNLREYRHLGAFALALAIVILVALVVLMWFVVGATPARAEPIVHPTYTEPTPAPAPAATKKPKPQKKAKALTGWALWRHLAKKEAARQRAKGLRVWSVDLALLCIRRESGGAVRATNGRYRGLFQIDEAFSAGRWDLYDPKVNFHVAADLYGRRGWQPWSTMRGY